MNNGQLTNIVEALLFAAAEPLPIRAMSRVLEDTKNEDIERALSDLNQRYVEANASFRVREIAGGYQLCTLPEYAGYIETLLARTKKQRLSSAALETLAVIAYRQPVTGPEIEKIRGVDSGGVLRTLLERKIVCIAGRSDKPGRPLLYGTTKEFLYYFGLNHLQELPRIEELEKLLKQHEAGAQLPINLDSETVAARIVSWNEADETDVLAGEKDVSPTESMPASEGDDVSARRLVLKKTASEETEPPIKNPDEAEMTESVAEPDEEDVAQILEIPVPDDPEEQDQEELLRTAAEVVTSFE